MLFNFGSEGFENVISNSSKVIINIPPNNRFNFSVKRTTDYFDQNATLILNVNHTNLALEALDELILQIKIDSNLYSKIYQIEDDK